MVIAISEQTSNRATNEPVAKESPMCRSAMVTEPAWSQGIIATGLDRVPVMVSSIRGFVEGVR